MRKIGAVITAAGHGKLDARTKLLEPLGGKPILLHVVENVKAAGFGPVVVVTNHLFGSEIREMLTKAGHTDLLYAVQPQRRGAADAVNRCLPILQSLKVTDFLVCFGDMPLQSVKNLKLLGEKHISVGAALSYSYWPCDTGHELAGYMKDYAYLCEERLYLYNGQAPVQGSHVFSSAYVLDAEWFARAFPRIPPMDTKRDGFGPEYHLPRLLEIAQDDGNLIPSLPVSPHEIIGVNTTGDMKLVCRLYLMYGVCPVVAA